MSSKQLLMHSTAVALAITGFASRAGALALGATVTGGDQATTTVQTSTRPAEQQRETKAKKKAQQAQKRVDAAKDGDAAAPPAGGPPTDSDIVVRGVRSSLAKARETKRASDSIVDVVDAEDIGKLPNNTVGDVIASIPGISVYRTEGEVNDIQLRGLSNVQTTLGGTPIESGADRVASIADLPADLVKSVEVYKTRSPDQVEGSGAGTINIEFRKPVDFKEGMTVSANATARYNNQSRKLNQVYTGIVNYRRETGIGDLGLQLGFTVNYNPFLESKARNDPLAAVPTRQVVGPQILPLPTYAPSQVAFIYTTGSRTTPTFNGALQWSPSARDTIVLDGTYAAPTFDRYTNSLYPPIVLQSNSTNNLPALSNIVLVPGTNRMASVTVSPVTQIGPISDISTSDDSNFLLRLVAKHSEEQFDASAEIAWTGANRNYQLLTLRNRFVNRPTYDVEFASDKFRYPMMNLDFRDLDLLDPNQYRFFGVVDRREIYENRNLATRVDLTLRTFIKPIDYIKFGLRFTTRTAQRQVGQREIRDLQIPLSGMPDGYQTLIPIAKGFEGTGVVNNARWLSYDRAAVREHYGDLRQFVSTFSPAFSTDLPAQDASQTFRGDERTIAAYAMAHYKMKLLFPIDGIFGARITNTAVNNLSYSLRTVRQVVNNVTTQFNVLTPNEGHGNYLNIEPTATAVIRFKRNFDLRLSYNVGIRRPSVGQITPYISFSDVSLDGSAGNPDLKPEKTIRYDAILEYFFGRIGTITINPFYWKINGTFANFQTLENVSEGSPDLLYRISKPYNAGNGYRRGVELQAQTFFTFLPGILKNFGVIGNYTYVESLLRFDSIPGSPTAPPASVPIVGIPKNVFNVQGLFERGGFNARVSYNFNGRLIDGYDSGVPLTLSRYVAPRDWMDAAINYTVLSGPLKNLGFSIQVQNVLAATRRSFYGFPDQPRDVTYMARVYGGTVRYRF